METACTSETLAALLTSTQYKERRAESTSAVNLHSVETHKLFQFSSGKYEYCCSFFLDFQGYLHPLPQIIDPNSKSLLSVLFCSVIEFVTKRIIIVWYMCDSM
jgi:hypothetical protein